MPKRAELAASHRAAARHTVGTHTIGPGSVVPRCTDPGTSGEVPTQGNRAWCVNYFELITTKMTCPLIKGRSGAVFQPTSCSSLLLAGLFLFDMACSGNSPSCAAFLLALFVAPHITGALAETKQVARLRALRPYR